MARRVKGRPVKVGYKVFFGLLGAIAIITEIVVLLERGVFNPGNFFSYFTILSNIFASVMLLVAAGYLIAKKTSARLDFYRGASTLFMVTTGVVFSLLLSGLQDVQFTATPWDNLVLHYIIPIVMLADWLWDQPSVRVPFKKALLWLAVPLAYFAYSLIRGVFVDWYPYPFLDPANGGYGQVLVTSLIITIFGVIAVFVVSSIGARKSSK